MTQFLSRIHRYKDLYQVLTKYPEAFNQKPEAEAMLSAIGSITDQLNELSVQLTQPLTPVYATRKGLRDNLKAAFVRLSGVIIVIATRNNNEALLAEVRQYRSMLTKSNYLSLYQLAQQLSVKLAEITPDASGLGLNADDVAAYNLMVSEYGAMIGETSIAMNSRKVNRVGLKTLLTSAHKLFADQCDHFVNMSRAAHPALYAEYTTLRRKTGRRKPAAADDTADISGSVTDALTGQPIAGASVGLVEQGSLTETDADGLFFFEELGTGNYNLRCFAPGYMVPANIPVSIAADESLEYTFALTPLPVAG